MKRLLLLSTTLLCILFYTDCTSVKTIVVDIRRPAEVILPKSIENIGIVNNAVVQPPTFGHNILKYQKNGKKLLEEVTVKSDSNIILFNEMLFEELSNQDYFENVSFYEYPLREDLAFLRSPRVDSLDVKELARVMNADAIISLDRLLITTVSHNQRVSFSTQDQFLDLITDAVLHIYSKDGNLISLPIYYSDSLSWEKVYSEESLFPYDNLIDRKDAIKVAIEYAAKKIAWSLTPQWTEEYRIYYGDVKEANRAAKSNNWQQALDLWTKAYEAEQKNIKKKVRLAENIALAYEMTDQLKEALRWADTAVRLLEEISQTTISMGQYNKNETSKYYLHLLKRHNEFRILDLQKRNFD